MSTFETEQEAFWAGRFGDDYTDRNHGERLLRSSLELFSRILSHTDGVRSVIEFGSNIGLNLLAIRRILPHAELSAVELNEKAQVALAGIQDVRVYPRSVLTFSPDYPRDFVFTKGLLIHVDPRVLTRVYDHLYQTSRHYLCVIEYYNPTPVEVPYRGHRGKLFKRDFTGDLLDRFPDLQLVGYGFVYHRDIHFPLDDVTWFLLSKASITFRREPPQPDSIAETGD